MQKNKNKVNHKNYLKDTKILVGIILVLVCILLISSITLLKKFVESRRTIVREQEYDLYSSQLLEASDYLTNQIFSFVVNGVEENYENYITELEVTKRREAAVEGLIQLGVTKTEEDLINATLQLSDELALIEIDAINLVHGEDLSSAQSLIFCDNYDEYKDKIRSNYKVLKQGMQSRISAENELVLNSVYISFGITALVVIGIVIASILLFLNFFKLIEESDIDPLTGLLNRNRYKEKIKKLVSESPEKYGAMIYCDIDSLKFINDCYGHINGDKYLQAASDVLRVFEEYPSVLARPSGDEFVVYVHGFDSVEAAKNTIDEKLRKAKDTYFLTSLHVEEKIRFSTGIAMYPDDSTNVDELLVFSDYALFKMKKSSKGEVGYYDKVTFDKGTFLYSNKGYINTILEEELLDFAMQPIVDAKTIEIYGYEALMRPQLEVINSPFLLLQLAKDESKLDKIERLVFKKAFEKINNNIEKLRNYKVFVNSVADQMLSQEELKDYLKNTPDLLKNVIVEVTEQEYVSEEMLRVKTDMFKELGALIALDDYGSGYSNEFSLLSGLYDIIKIDMNIVRNIDADIKRQEIVRSLIKVSEINNYKVLAEGVETLEEVRILQQMGVHYFQGYFFGKPDLEIKALDDSVYEKLGMKKV